MTVAAVENLLPENTRAELPAKKDEVAVHLGKLVGLAVEWHGESDAAKARAITDALTYEATPEEVVAALGFAEATIQDPSALGDVHFGLADRLVNGLSFSQQSSSLRMQMGLSLLENSVVMEPKKKVDLLEQAVTCILTNRSPHQHTEFPVFEDDDRLGLYRQAVALKLATLEKWDSAGPKAIDAALGILVPSKDNEGFVRRNASTEVIERACKYIINHLPTKDLAKRQKAIEAVIEWTLDPAIINQATEAAQSLYGQYQTNLAAAKNEVSAAESQLQQAREQWLKRALTKKARQRRQAAKSEIETAHRKLHGAKELTLLNERGLFRLMTNLTNIGRNGLIFFAAIPEGQKLLKFIAQNDQDFVRDGAKAAFEQGYKDYASGDHEDYVTDESLKKARAFLTGPEMGVQL
ncbi:MAG TPA: hypothetical protein VLG37_01395 [Candidatus Saccharimonadales bacterium]|nr:hypothetical protein [Candidatus Saccharimonadales bacterium]